MTITTAVLKRAPDRFHEVAQTEDLVAKDGTSIARIAGAAVAKEERLDALNRSAGVIAGSETARDQIKGRDRLAHESDR